MALLRPRLGDFGITRLAEQTGLDVTGMPCWAAIRPNSRTLAVNQGKGTTDAAAQVSAVMEAIEFCVAESPEAAQVTASVGDLMSDRRPFFIPYRKLPARHVVPSAFDLTWVEGQDLVSGKPVLVPLDAVALAPNASERIPFAQSSNGLGAGFGMQEAVVHAVCEVAERDASTLWSLRRPHYQSATAIALTNAAEEASTLVSSLAKSALETRLFDLTTEASIPTVMALVWSGDPRLYFDVASGVCAHPDGQKAALGALMEAAQTRVSNISGSRDDIEPAEYEVPIPDWIRLLLKESHNPTRAIPASLDGLGFDDWLKRTGTSDTLISVPLSTRSDVVVVKVLSEGLEDRSTNIHWQPGSRATRAATSI